MNVRSTVVAAMVSLLTAGCPNFINANGPPFSAAAPPEGKAVVYFYRPPQRIMSDYPFFMSIPVSANNCFALESGGYTAHVTDPGELSVVGIMVSLKAKSLELAAGDVRYVRIDIVDDDAVMTDVPEAEAKAEITATRGIETCLPDKLKPE